MNSDLPEGTVTFLFSDIEGSTRLWEQHPEGMKIALTRHDEILRRAVEVNRGRVVKTTGDGCYAVFETAQGAVLATLAAQQALLAEPWDMLRPESLRVRMAVHTGEAELRAGDYYGITLNRSARLMTSAHGGQVLLSASSAELVRDSLPAEVRLRDLGEHRLKDLSRPERVFQILAPTLQSEFPPLRATDASPNNLPAQLTRFIGREREMEQVQQMLAQARLLTLTGPGGAGKTRLAIEVGAALVQGIDRRRDAPAAFPDGVWLAELASISAPELVADTVASALGLRPTNRPAMEVLVDNLRGKRLLLILDNCEHLISACAELADALLRACPALSIIATSREALNVAGETVWTVPSLTTEEAVQLFANRARAAQPRFELTGKTGLWWCTSASGWTGFRWRLNSPPPGYGRFPSSRSPRDWTTASACW